jgi:hypothetical protein
MDAVLVFLPAALAIAVAAAAMIVLRRSGDIAAESREATQGRMAIAALAARADDVIGAAAALIDQLRRGQVDATAVGDDVSDAAADITALRVDASELPLPSGLAGTRSAIVGELERAERALDMVEHGRSIMTTSRLRGREIEAQTAVKRGYLNLLHARDAIDRQATIAAGWRSPTEARARARNLS